jgi:hypothetical protein
LVGRSKARRWADEDEDLLSEGDPSSVVAPSLPAPPPVQMLVPLPPNASPRPRLKSVLVRAGDGGPVHGPQAVSQERRRGRRCHRSQLLHGLPLRRTIRRLNVFQLNNGWDPGCLATTTSRLRMRTGGRMPYSVASWRCGDCPTGVKLPRHQGRAPRPWHALRADAFGALRETTRLLLVGIRSGASAAEVAGMCRSTAQHAAASTIDDELRSTQANMLIDALSTGGLPSTSSRRSVGCLCHRLL